MRFLTASVSFIQCWKELGVKEVGEFRALESRGAIMYRGELPQFVRQVRQIVQDSEILTEQEIDWAIEALKADYSS
jgi:hypothetical protein